MGDGVFRSASLDLHARALVRHGAGSDRPDRLALRWRVGFSGHRSALAPLTVIVARFAFHVGDTTTFVLAALALMPLAWLIGEATEHVAEHTGPGIGGFLNASFGNAPELIIALIAVDNGLPEVVRGSHHRLGRLEPAARARLLDARRRPRRARPALDVPPARDRAGGDGRLPDPRVPGWHGDPDRHALYLRHAAGGRSCCSRSTSASRSTTCAATAPSTSRESPPRRLELRSALVVLGGATVATALVAEMLVGSLEAFARDGRPLGLLRRDRDRRDRRQRGRARRRNRRRAARQDQARHRDRGLVGAQVAVFLIPAVALLSWPIEPLALSFRPVEIGVIGGSALLTPACSQRAIEPLARRGADRGLCGRRSGLLQGRRTVVRSGGSEDTECPRDRLDRTVDVVVGDVEVRRDPEDTRPEHPDRDALLGDPPLRLGGVHPDRGDVDTDEVRLCRADVDRQAGVCASPCASRFARA